MFLPDSKKESSVELFEENLGKTEPILQLGNALFLARFMCTLSYTYREFCVKEG